MKSNQPMQPCFRRSLVPFILGSAFVILLVYGLCLRTHYAVDTYSHLLNTAEHIASTHYGGGRYLAGFLVLALDFLGVQSGTHQYIGVSLLMMSLALCAGTFSCIVYCNCKKEQDSPLNALAIGSAMLLSFVNPFMTEWFLFPEACIVFAASVFLMFLSCCITYYCKTPLGFILSVLTLYFSLSCYQVILGMYLMFSILLELSRSGSCWSTHNVVYTIRVLLTGLVASLLSIVVSSWINPLLGIVSNDRSATFHFSDIISNIIEVLRFQDTLWISGMRTMPDYSILVTFMVLCVLLCIAVYSTYKSEKGRLCNVLFFSFLFLAGGGFSSFAPLYVTSNFWPAHRVLPAFMTAFSVLGCLIVMNKPGERVRSATAAVLIAFLAVCSFSSQRIQNNTFLNIALDKQYISNIETEIREYESETDITVQKIGFVSDTSPSYAYNGQTFSTYDLGITVRQVPWAFVNAVSYYTEREFTHVEIPPDIYEEHFRGKNYDSYDDSQIVLEGDAIYILQY